LTNSEVVAAFAELADEVWDLVKAIDDKASYLGNQLMRAVDSIGANLCEGYGREYPGSVTQFYRYAKGSALESIWWLDRVISRRLVPIRDSKDIRDRLLLATACIDMLIDGLKKK
jgi:four helix bundle protein